MVESTWTQDKAENGGKDIQAGPGTLVLEFLQVKETGLSGSSTAGEERFFLCGADEATFSDVSWKNPFLANLVRRGVSYLNLTEAPDSATLTFSKNARGYLFTIACDGKEVKVEFDPAKVKQIKLNGKVFDTKTECDKLDGKKADTKPDKDKAAASDVVKEVQWDDKELATALKGGHRTVKILPSKDLPENSDVCFWKDSTGYFIWFKGLGPKVKVYLGDDVRTIEFKGERKDVAENKKAVDAALAKKKPAEDDKEIVAKADISKKDELKEALLKSTKVEIKGLPDAANLNVWREKDGSWHIWYKLDGDKEVTRLPIGDKLKTVEYNGKTLDIVQKRKEVIDKQDPKDGTLTLSYKDKDTKFFAEQIQRKDYQRLVITDAPADLDFEHRLDTKKGFYFRIKEGTKLGTKDFFYPANLQRIEAGQDKWLVDEPRMALIQASVREPLRSMETVKDKKGKEIHIGPKLGFENLQQGNANTVFGFANRLTKLGTESLEMLEGLLEEQVKHSKDNPYLQIYLADCKLALGVSKYLAAKDDPKQTNEEAVKKIRESQKLINDAIKSTNGQFGAMGYPAPNLYYSMNPFAFWADPYCYWGGAYYQARQRAVQLRILGGVLDDDGKVDERSAKTGIISGTRWRDNVWQKHINSLQRFFKQGDLEPLLPEIEKDIRWY